MRCRMMLRAPLAPRLAICRTGRRRVPPRRSGGLDLLFGNQKSASVDIPATTGQLTLGQTVVWARDNLLTERPELFMKDDSVCVERCHHGSAAAAAGVEGALDVPGNQQVAPPRRAAPAAASFTRPPPRTLCNAPCALQEARRAGSAER